MNILTQLLRGARGMQLKTHAMYFNNHFNV